MRVSGCHFFSLLSAPAKRIHVDRVTLTAIVPLVIFIKYSCFDVVCVGCSQNGLATKVEKSRKQMKERRNRAKKIRGVKKVIFSLMVTTHCFLCVTLDWYSYNQD